MEKSPGRMKHSATPWVIGYKSDGTIVILTKRNLFSVTVLAVMNDAATEFTNGNANRIIECVNALEGIEDPIKMRQTWDVVKELELDAFHKLKQDHDAIIEIIREMRIHQKEFFRNRTLEALEKSKELEREVDRYLLPTDKTIKQTRLFER